MQPAGVERPLSIFLKLRAILQAHAEGLLVTADTPGRYCLEGRAGPATLQAWGGKSKRPLIPVAWVEVGKSGVSYHLMGVYENAKLQRGMSKPLKTRMNGKSCFTVKADDDASLVKEIEQVTAQPFAAFRTAGSTSNHHGASRQGGA
jgi:hypothetical protein